jgi:uncharacterized membrane protein
MNERQQGRAGSVGSTDVSISRYLSRGWQILQQDLALWVLASILYSAVLGVVSTTGIGAAIVLGPLEVGWYAVILKRLRTGALDLDEIARGFHRFVPAFLAGVAVLAFAFLGFAFFILPGIVVLALYLFVWPILLDEDVDFWSAMERSRRKALRHWPQWCLFVVVIGLIHFAGLLFCGVGLLVTLPWTKIAVALAYEEHFRAAPSPASPPQ